FQVTPTAGTHPLSLPDALPSSAAQALERDLCPVDAGARDAGGRREGVDDERAAHAEASAGALDHAHALERLEQSRCDRLEACVIEETLDGSWPVLGRWASAPPSSSAAMAGNRATKESCLRHRAPARAVCSRRASSTSARAACSSRPWRLSRRARRCSTPTGQSSSAETW